MSYSWSRNEENFSCEFETRNQALDEAIKCNPGQVALWTGENIKKTTDDFFNVDSLLDDIQCSADDVCGEASEGWLPTSYKSQLDKKAELAKIICDYIDREWPIKFWLVDNIVKHEVKS